MKDHVNINNSSLNLDDNISKRKRIATNVYTDNNNKKDKIKTINWKNINEYIRKKAREAIKRVISKKQAQLLKKNQTKEK